MQYSSNIIRICKTIVAVLLIMAAGAWLRETAAQAAADGAKEFQVAVQKYIDIQKKAVNSVPALGNSVTDAALIAQHEKRVADAIRALRPHAKQGEIFTPSAKKMIMSIVKQHTSGKEGAAARAVILGEGNPKSPEESAVPINLAVNAPYPTSAPLSTMPPSVLMALPTLPKELEFRFVGRTLILRDAQANMIVDLIPNVL
jgi:hypothetical protein